MLSFGQEFPGLADDVVHQVGSHKTPCRPFPYTIKCVLAQPFGDGPAAHKLIMQHPQAFSVVVAGIGLAGFALVLALVEQVVLVSAP